MLDIHKLNKLIKEKNFTNKSISKLLENYGVKKSETAIQKYRNGINDPDTKTLSILADILDVTEQDFFVGSSKRKEKIALEEIKKSPHKYRHIYEKQNIKNELKQCKLINHKTEHIYIDNFCLDASALECDISAFVVSGDSMHPYLSDGDIALFKCVEEDAITYDGKYIIETTVGLQVKNIKFLSDGSIKIISENPAYRTLGTYDEEVKKDDANSFKVVGSIVGRIKVK